MKRPLPLWAAVLFVFILVIGGCGKTTVEPDLIEINEIKVENASIPARVSLDNCDGKVIREETVEHAFKLTIEGIKDAKNNAILQANLQNRYIGWKDKKISQKYSADPGTNMVYIISKEVDKRTGTVRIGSETGIYAVEIPLAIKQVSVRDAGCGNVKTVPNTGSPTETLSGPTPATTEQASSVELIDCALIRPTKNCVGRVVRHEDRLNITLILNFPTPQASYEMALEGEDARYPCKLVAGTSDRYYCPRLPDKTGQQILLQVYQPGTMTLLAQGYFLFDKARITEPTPIPPTPLPHNGPPAKPPTPVY